jgi:hypothetical protein
MRNPIRYIAILLCAGALAASLGVRSPASAMPAAEVTVQIGSMTATELMQFKGTIPFLNDCEKLIAYQSQLQTALNAVTAAITSAELDAFPAVDSILTAHSPPATIETVTLVKDGGGNVTAVTISGQNP